ncbi:hypothetical protein IE81DRAFT_345176 [Ceraceosorus guamensis]|uniref:Btz domain-containing protein n=1 Tax=Ceraceosorus guamensis TaxID=1522189 RepID=A0A316W5A8_9BASI|nr:hypothetical protein IE81DRAFT_345176 [Ceraceosorus guamensis]PWN45130.1 hypothetical protein IE81DRAFT_345176 [Ceraceosorus guamensis]
MSLAPPSSVAAASTSHSSAPSLRHQVSASRISVPINRSSSSAGRALPPQSFGAASYSSTQTSSLSSSSSTGDRPRRHRQRRLAGETNGAASEDDNQSASTGSGTSADSSSVGSRSDGESGSERAGRAIRRLREDSESEEEPETAERVVSTSSEFASSSVVDAQERRIPTGPRASHTLSKDASSAPSPSRAAPKTKPPPRTPRAGPHWNHDDRGSMYAGGEARGGRGRGRGGRGVRESLARGGSTRYAPDHSSNATHPREILQAPQRGSQFPRRGRGTGGTTNGTSPLHRAQSQPQRRGLLGWSESEHSASDSDEGARVDEDALRGRAVRNIPSAAKPLPTSNPSLARSPAVQEHSDGPAAKAEGSWIGKTPPTAPRAMRAAAPSPAPPASNLGSFPGGTSSEVTPSISTAPPSDALATLSLAAPSSLTGVPKGPSGKWVHDGYESLWGRDREHTGHSHRGRGKGTRRGATQGRFSGRPQAIPRVNLPPGSDTQHQSEQQDLLDKSQPSSLVNGSPLASAVAQLPPGFVVDAAGTVYDLNQTPPMSVGTLPELSANRSDTSAQHGTGRARIQGTGASPSAAVRSRHERSSSAAIFANAARSATFSPSIHKLSNAAAVAQPATPQPPATNGAYRQHVSHPRSTASLFQNLHGVEVSPGPSSPYIYSPAHESELYNPSYDVGSVSHFVPSDGAHYYLPPAYPQHGATHYFQQAYGASPAVWTADEY